jgi:hypothetical protein
MLIRLDRLSTPNSERSLFGKRAYVLLYDDLLGKLFILNQMWIIPGRARRIRSPCHHCYNLTYKCQKERDKTIDALRRNPLLMESQLMAGDAIAAMAAMKVCSRLGIEANSLFFKLSIISNVYMLIFQRFSQERTE